jgi:hypothetical protein
MEAKWYELGRRAVACKHWQWMPGMLVLAEGWGHYVRIIAVDDEGEPVVWEHDGYTCGPLNGNQVGDETPWRDWAKSYRPMFTDDATMGCLLSLVRRAYEPIRGKDSIASTMHTNYGWGVGARFGSEGFAAICLPTSVTEADALVLALENAP